MKKYQSFISIFELLLIISVFTSCERNDNETHDSKLIDTWKLIDIEFDEQKNFNSYDSTKCINSIPYGFVNGNKYRLSGSSNQPDSLVEFHVNREHWTFLETDTLIIKRDGYEPSSCFCENGEVVFMVSPGFPCLTLKANWESFDNTLIIKTQKNESDLFYINHIGFDSLVLDFFDKKLFFIKSED